MDATTLTGHVKELNAANQAGKSDVSGALGVVSPMCLRRSFVHRVLTGGMTVYRKLSLYSRNCKLRLSPQKTSSEYVFIGKLILYKLKLAQFGVSAYSHPKLVSQSASFVPMPHHQSQVLPRRSLRSGGMRLRSQRRRGREQKAMKEKM